MLGGKKQEASYWIKRLRHRKLETRRKAVEALGNLGDAKAVQPLVELLESGDVSLRWETAEALGKIGSPDAVDSLVTALKDTDWNVRQNAAKALGLIGDIRAVQPLIDAFYDKDDDVRREIVIALGAIDDTRAVETLLHALDDKMFTVRWRAVQMLGKICDARAIVPLLKLRRDTSTTIRESAETALKTICTAVESVTFGQPTYKNPQRDLNLMNPDVTDLTVPMPSLQRIDIYPEAAEFHHIERFITYAVNHIGQKHLKKRVVVYIHGDVSALHHNLRNSLENLCKKVEVR